MLLALAALHIILARRAWTGIALQTDTGMWAYIGARILDGALPYRDLWESKPPGIYYTFALVEWLFGSGSDRALMWTDAVVNAALLWITFAVARRRASAFASACAILPLSVVICHCTLADWGNNVEKFVALFEMAAFYAFLGALNHARSLRLWLATGVLCGLASMFKQTGVLFLSVVSIGVIMNWRRIQDASNHAIKYLAILWTGAALVWMPVIIWMAAAGNLRNFVEQVILFDFSRVASDQPEISRLASIQHWLNVGLNLKMLVILLGPLLFGLLYRSKSDDADRTVQDAAPVSPNLVVNLYWLAVVAVFCLAPFGYGHYLLQAAPAMAVALAWALEDILHSAVARRGLLVMSVAGLIGAYWCMDHWQFTFDPSCAYRRVYARQSERIRTLATLVKDNSRLGQGVMLWPADYAVSYYADRRTPLEGSNSDVIFKNKIARLRPSIDTLRIGLEADPPEIIVDTTLLQVSPATSGKDPEIIFLQGLSLFEPPMDDHPLMEGRVLAPLKRWLWAHYGGQVRIGDIATIYYRGKPWRNWPEFVPATP